MGIENRNSGTFIQVTARVTSTLLDKIERWSIMLGIIGVTVIVLAVVGSSRANADPGGIPHCHGNIIPGFCISHGIWGRSHAPRTP